VETLLGLQLEVDHLRITPCIPAHWKSYIIHYRFRETFYHITVKCNDEKSSQGILVTMDGIVVNNSGNDEKGLPQCMIPLVDDHQQHHVEVRYADFHGTHNSMK